MTSTTTVTSLAFRPWSLAKPEEPALGEILARVHNERGHFRDITEASLQEEIATEGALDLSSSDDEDDNEDEDAASTKRKAPTTREELYAAKREMMSFVDAAHQDIMLSLDFIALLESKHAPSQAQVSMSQALKGGAPSGSLGTDVWDPRAMPVDKAREAQDALLASTVRMESLQKSADDLLSAATRLEDNVRKEATFWDEILSISQRGWSVSRIPRSHLLGVHFGFGGCAPEFAGRNVAALVGDADGNVALERGIGSKPKAIRVVIKKADRIVGSSKLPSLPESGNITLDARIRHARDSVYDEELYHEMIRESRNLASLGVSMQDRAIKFSDASGDIQVELEQVTLNEDNVLPTNATNESDMLAQGMLLLARLLLGQKHREKLYRAREIPEPMSEKKDEKQQAFAILRSLTLLLKHHSEVSQVNAYVAEMSRLLRTLHTSAECQPARFGFSLPAKEQVTTESLTSMLSRPLSSEAMVRIVAFDNVNLELKIHVEIFPSRGFGSYFTVFPVKGEKIVMDDLIETFAAADDMLTLASGQVLQNIAGDAWQFDERTGLLNWASGDRDQDAAWFCVDSTSKTISLIANTSNKQKEAVWKLDGSGETRALRDVWHDLVG